MFAGNLFPWKYYTYIEKRCRLACYSCFTFLRMHLQSVTKMKKNLLPSDFPKNFT